MDDDEEHDNDDDSTSPPSLRVELHKYRTLIYLTTIVEMVMSKKPRQQPTRSSPRSFQGGEGGQAGMMMSNDED